ncbi:MAG: amidohydrolase family protein [Deltaproteobacteria bacterium]|uniref:Amidohydrolase family protein n=1 Tax=Candidatus Zymogenus saltonus TaxID=2844893 RepID=A0A9D8KGY1_9DELT|nr:amidohydrolase family protein [Candidatus Zymogenus saltonus]
MSDLLIKNALIVDGTGAEPYSGHILIKGDRIVEVVSDTSTDSKDLLKKKAKETFDLKGLALSPGIIDCHSHFDWIITQKNHTDFANCMMEQGVTTVVTGNCGFSPVPTNKKSQGELNRYAEFFLDTPIDYKWTGISEYNDCLNSGKKLLFNNAQLTGHGTLHLMTTGDEVKKPSPEDLKGMVKIAKKSFDEGSFGMSFGLQYHPGIFSTDEELTTLAGVVADADRILTVHIKSLSKYSSVYPLLPALIPGGKAHNIKAIEHIIKIASKVGVRLQISHFVFAGKRTWPTAKKAVKIVRKARKNGLDVMYDMYPIFGGNSYINVVLPPWFLEDFEKNSKDPKAIKKLRFELNMTIKLVGMKYSDIQVMDSAFKGGEKYNGLNIMEIAEMEGMDPVDVFIMLVRESKGKTLAIVYALTGDEENEEMLESLMSNELVMFETDTILRSTGVPNQASFGAFPKLLGRYTRDKGVMTLAECVHKMTGKSAERFKIKDRGTIKPGNFADLVIFDPDRIADTTTRKNSSSKPLGIDKVFSNGVLTVENGNYIKGVTPGRALSCS